MPKKNIFVISVDTEEDFLPSTTQKIIIHQLITFLS